jgi:hypothetical protein
MMAAFTRFMPRLLLIATLVLGGLMPAGAFTYSTALKNTRMDAITTAIGASGHLRMYPTGTSTCSGTIIADLALSATAAPAASSGVLTFNAITSATATSSATAICATLTTSGGTVVVDGLSVGTSATNIVLNSNVISSGQTVSVTSATLTHG